MIRSSRPRYDHPFNVMGSLGYYNWVFATIKKAQPQKEKKAKRGPQVNLKAPKTKIKRGATRGGRPRGSTEGAKGVMGTTRAQGETTPKKRTLTGNNFLPPPTNDPRVRGETQTGRAHQRTRTGRGKLPPPAQGEGKDFGAGDRGGQGDEGEGFAKTGRYRRGGPIERAN